MPSVRPDFPARAAAGFLVVALLGSCSGQADAGKGTAAAGGTPVASGSPAPRSFRVKTAPVELRDVTYTIEAVGSIETERETQVVAGVEGIVTSVRFREGDAVTPATVLATIDPERYRMQADRARANFEKIEAQHRQAISDQKRREALLTQTPPLVSEEEVERARQETERMRASVAEARAQHEMAHQDEERSIVRSLIPGVINSRTVSVGQHVEAKAMLATLVDSRRLNVRFRVSEQESTRIGDGMEILFTSAPRPGHEFRARVFHVSSTADPATRMVEVLARIEKDVHLLKPGFFAEIRADVESHKGAIVIPDRAVLPTERGFVAYEVKEGRAVRRQVALGLRTRDGGIEILSGLGPDAIVVTDGGDVLRDGAPVQIQEDPAATPREPAAR